MDNTKNHTEITDTPKLQQPPMCSWLCNSNTSSKENLKTELQKCKETFSTTEDENDTSDEAIIQEILNDIQTLKINQLDPPLPVNIYPKFHLKNKTEDEIDPDTTQIQPTQDISQNNNEKDNDGVQESKNQNNDEIDSNNDDEDSNQEDIPSDETEGDLGKEGEEDNFFIYLDNTLNPTTPVWIGGNKYNDTDNDAVFVQAGETNIIFYGSNKNISSNQIKIWYNYYYNFQHQTNLIYNEIKRGSVVKIPKIELDTYKMLQLTFEILHLTESCPVLDLFPEEYAADLQDRCYVTNSNKYFPLFYKKLSSINREKTHVWLAKYKNIKLYDIATNIASFIPPIDPYIILQTTKNQYHITKFNQESKKFLPYFYNMCLDNQQKKDFLNNLVNRYFDTSKELASFPIKSIKNL